jgi:16S rRNA (uracil1498-N3)-methyltransferase
MNAELDEFESKHLRTTLRKQIGDVIDATDGCGFHYKAKIITIKPRVSLEILNKKFTGANNAQINLGVGFIKPNRLEFILEKGTELGVRSFYFFRSEHANYYSDNLQRFQKIVRQAIKQSNRFYMPEIKLFKRFSEFIQTSLQIENRIAAIDPTFPTLNAVINDTGKDFLFCIGPEGGFSPAETELMNKNGFTSISLGKYRLRAETAAIAAVATLQFSLDDKTEK